MKTRTMLFAAGGLALAALGFAIFEFVRPTLENEKAVPPREAQETGERTILYYRNPMGLPGTSPVPKKDSMGMDYIPVYADEAPSEALPPGTVTLTPQKIQRAGVRTEPVIRRTLRQTVRSAGIVMADESRLAVVAMKFDGVIEELFVSTTGAPVKAGQPLMRVWIESRDILAKEADLLAILRTDGQGVEQAEANLRQFGIPEDAIAEMRRTLQPLRSIVIRAHAAGTVLEKLAVVGTRFMAGDVLFRTANLSTVWVLAQVPENDLALLQAGQEARLSPANDPGASFPGLVSFIYPMLDTATRTGQVRIVVPNPDGELKLGQYAEVVIEAPVGEGPVLAIPRSAVLDSGTRQVAFVATGEGVFEPRDLILGRRAGGYVEVKGGLIEGEAIVTSGNFLIDAESNLQAAIAAFKKPEDSK